MLVKILVYIYALLTKNNVNKISIINNNEYLHNKYFINKLFNNEKFQIIDIITEPCQ